MTEHVTDELVETAAKAWWDYGRDVEGDTVEWEMRHPTFREFDLDSMRAAIEAVAPSIAAKALEAARAPYRCCPHCADDSIHDVEKDHHTVPCQLCQNDEINRVAAKALRDAADDFATTLSGRRDVQGILRARADRIERGEMI